MPRGMNTLAEFGCFNCGKPLGWTSPGEAGRINVRAHVFCDVCKELPVGLTDRQQQLVDSLAAQKERGERPSLSKAAEEMGVSRSRVQQIKDAIKARGANNEIDVILYGPVASLPMPNTVTREEVAAQHTVPSSNNEPSDNWEYPAPEGTSSTPASNEDPAVFGGEFIV